MTSSHSFRGQGHFSHHRNSHFTAASKINHHHHHSNNMRNHRDSQNPSSSNGEHLNSVVIKSQNHRLSPTLPSSLSNSSQQQSQPLNMSNKDKGLNKQNNVEEERPTKLTSFSVMDILSPSKFKPVGPTSSSKILPAMPSLRPIHHPPPAFMTSQLPGAHAEYLTQRQNLVLHSHVKSLQHHQHEATVSRPNGEYIFIELIFYPALKK